MTFELQHTDGTSHARAGKITTGHGVIETPIFMPVGTLHTPLTGIKFLQEVKILLRKELEPWKLSTF